MSNARSLADFISDGVIGSDEIADSAITASKLASGAAVSNIGYTPLNLDSEGYGRSISLPIGTYNSPSGYTNTDAKLFKLSTSASCEVSGVVLHIGDHNYANLVSYMTFNLFGWDQDSTYKMNIREHHGRPSSFAVDADGTVWLRNSDLWHQTCYLFVFHRQNCDFSVAGSTQTREGHSSVFHECPANSTLVREAAFGT